MEARSSNFVSANCSTQAIEKFLDDTTKKTKYEGGVDSEPATEPWQLAIQRCEESRKRRNEHVRAR